MKSKSTQILKLLYWISWTVFLGICIKAGALIYSYFISLFFNANAAKNLYSDLNLFQLKISNESSYSLLVLAVISITIAQAALFYTVIQIFNKINFLNPFHYSVAKLIKKMSLISLLIGVVSKLALAYSDSFLEEGMVFPNLKEFIGSGSIFLFFAGILLFFHLLFIKGIELQNDNELTI
jgi:hypothetical protein